MVEDALSKGMAEAAGGLPVFVGIFGKEMAVERPSLGVSLMISNRLATLGISEEIMNVDPSLETLRVTAAHRDTVAEIAALTLCTGREARAGIYRERAEELKQLKNEDLASLLLMALQMMAEPTRLISGSPIGEDLEVQRNVAEAKGEGSSISFGGKTIFGQLIMPACEAFGCTPDVVRWDIALTDLRLCLADKVNTVYLDDEERRELGLPESGVKDISRWKLEDLQKL